LRSKEWSFDIVPCYHTVQESDGRSYYLIPNGSGNWQKTDPTIDRDKIKTVNERLDNRVLELIRLAKVWNRVKNATTLSSYVMETMVVNYCEGKASLSSSVRWNLFDFLHYFSTNIYCPVYDMKKIQGNLNGYSHAEQSKLINKAKIDVQKATDALIAERRGEHQKAINLWREILGEKFPTYG
jgi:hypothetical protein